ncbi:MAG: alcohol dehydrogenase catalytic domain-containing protein [Clostridiales bacterium]|nr:alcohol dehydrogenase catalytic domain-containing protein [Clostridiales bacterium]
MKAYRIQSPHTIGLDELAAQPVGETCVKLKNLICGIAGTDLAVYSGERPVQYPIIPGRQCVGFVSEVGSEVTGLARGNRVVVYSHASCHTCKACKDARYYDCEKPAVFGVDDNGFLSDFSVVSADDVFAIPDRLKDEEAIFTEHTSLAINVMSRLNIEKGEHLVIVGASIVGIILAQVAMYYQAVPIVVDMHEDRLDIAKQAGVYYTVNTVEDDAGKKVLSLTGGHMADACAFMSSSTVPLANAFDYCCKNGRVAIVGRAASMQDDLKCSLITLLEKNLDIFSVTDCGKNYPSAINMLANRTVAVDMLPTNIVPFAEAGEAIEKQSADDGAGKLLVKV